MAGGAMKIGKAVVDFATHAAPELANTAKKIAPSLNKGQFSALGGAPKTPGSGAAQMRRGGPPPAVPDKPSHLRSGAFGAAKDFAAGNLTPQHMLSAGADMASKFSKFTNPVNQADANTPHVPLTSEQNQMLDSANITAMQNQKVQMKMAEISMKNEQVSGLAHLMTDGVKKAMEALKGN